MASQSDIATQMISALGVSLPALDTTIGSPVRSILDVVAEAIAEAYADQYLLSYQYDIYTKSGSDLDNYVSQFGFTRLPGTRATGSITFSRTSPAPSDVYIPTGTQLSDNNTPPDIFNTLTPVILAQSTTSCSVPIQANVAGVAGNVAANTIVNCTNNLSGFSSLTNPSGLTGGSDPESDDQLRARFLATVFRNMAGTEPMFLGVALEDPDVTQANVIGATKTYSEIIQIVDGFGLSSVQDFDYLYPGTSVFGTDIFNGDILTPGVDYELTVDLVNPSGFEFAVEHSSSGTYNDFGTAHYAIVANTTAGASLPCTEVTADTTSGSTNSFSLSWANNYTTGDISSIISWDIYFAENSSDVQYLTTVPGTQTSYLDTGNITPNGDPPSENNAYTQPFVETNTDDIPDGIYQLQYDYLPNCSRNDPAAGITNRVDIYVNNTRAVEVAQDTAWTSAYVFTHNAGDTYDVINWSRLDGTQPEPGNYFIPFAFAPVLSMTSGTIEINSNTYVEGTDYWVVNNISPFGLSPISLSGFEWLSSDNGEDPIPSEGNAMTLSYDFNQIPQSVQAAIAAWALVTTDVQVHQAKVYDLNVYLGLIMSTTTYTQATVLSQVETALSNYFNSVTFDGVIQISEIISIVQNLPGVVAVRLLTSADDTSTTYPVNSQYSGTNYAIQSVNTDNEVLETFAVTDGSVFRATDVSLNDDTLAVLNNVYLKFYAQNTFGSV